MKLMNYLAIAIQDQSHLGCFLATPVKEPVMALPPRCSRGHYLATVRLVLSALAPIHRFRNFLRVCR